MHALYSNGIVLARTNFGESDRILTILTKDFGKLKLVARGVRKEKSKLAGGVELFCVSHFGFVESRGDLGVLVSTRLVKNHGSFIGDLNRVNFAYESLKKINKITEKNTETGYFNLTDSLLSYLSNLELPLETIEVWWYVNFAKLTGHSINLAKPINSEDFQETAKYIFIDNKGSFKQSENGFSAIHVKYLRIASKGSPLTLARVKQGQNLAQELIPLARGFVEYVH